MSFLQSPVITLTDSGAGGLAVLRSLLERMPWLNVVYLADNQHAPYGTKHRLWVCERTLEIAGYLTGLQPAAHLIGCNTACAVAMEQVILRHADTFILGPIQPGALAALAATHSGCIGVLATSLTVNSRAYTDAISRLQPDARVIELACDEFVGLAESGAWTVPETYATVEQHLVPWLQRYPEIDTVIGGCTHFPLLAAAIREVSAGQALFIDPADAAALALEQYLSAHKLAPLDQASPNQLLLLATGDAWRLSEHASRLLGRTLSARRVQLNGAADKTDTERHNLSDGVWLEALGLI